MKKTFCAILTAALLLSGGTLFAANLDYLGNQSVEWLQTLNRNAATDAADIINYNPAGTPFLSPGLHLNLSNQFLFKFYEHSFKMGALDETFEPEKLTPLLPNFYASYNFGTVGLGRLALNLQAGVTAGGGNLDYSDGTAGSYSALFNLTGPFGGAVRSQSFSASSIYYGVALGGAYSFLDDKLSASLGVRMVMPRRGFTLEGEFPATTVKAEYEYNALGFTPIIGFDIRPIEKLTIGLRYEFETALEFEYEQKKVSASAGATALVAVKALLQGAGLADGKKFNQNLPQIIGVGVEYEVIPGLAIDVSGTFYLLPYADVDLDDTKDVDDYFGLGYDLGLGLSWRIFEELKLGAGFAYTESGAKDAYFNEKVLNASANPPLDSITFGLGGTYSFAFGLDLNLGFLYSHYLPADYELSGGAVKGTNKKDVFEIGIGVAYHY